MHFQPSKHTQYMSGLTIIPALRNRLLDRGPLRNRSAWCFCWQTMMLQLQSKGREG